MWNSYILPLFRANVNIDHGSTLSPILFALYIVPIFDIFKKRTQNLLSSIPVSILSLVDDELFIINLVLQLNIASLKYFTSQKLPRTLIYPL